MRKIWGAPLLLYFLYLYFTGIRYGINSSYGDLNLNRSTEHKAHRKRRDNKILFINNNIPIMPYPFVEHIPNKWWHGSSLSSSYYYIVTCNQPKKVSMTTPAEVSRSLPLSNQNRGPDIFRYVFITIRDWYIILHDAWWFSKIIYI